MKTNLNGIDFTEALDARKQECLYANGTLAEMEAARNALLASGYSAQEPTFMYMDTWCIYGYAPRQEVSQAMMDRLEAYKFEAQHPAWGKGGKMKRRHTK